MCLRGYAPAKNIFDRAFCENEATKSFFHKRASSYMFDMALNTPLRLAFKLELSSRPTNIFLHEEACNVA